MALHILPEDIKRFKAKLLSKIDTSGGKDKCWPFIGIRRKKGNGYGQITVYDKRISVHAHRLSYALFIGPIPDGAFVCHACDYRPCCNPSHLWLGTHIENMLDAGMKGRITWNAPHEKGEDCAVSKLTDKEVTEMRELYGLSINQLAKRFNISGGAVYAVLARVTWKHLPISPKENWGKSN